MALIHDPMTQTPAQQAARGAWGRTHWWNILNSRPLLDAFMGTRDQKQLDTLTMDANAAFGAGHEMRPPSHRLYELVVHQDAGSQPRAIQGLDEWTYERGHHTGYSEYEWKYYIQPIISSEQDRLENQGGTRGITISNLEEWDYKVAIQKLLDKISTDLVLGDNTGNGNREMLGLAGAIPSNPTTNPTLVGGWNLALKPDMQNQYNAILPGAPVAGAAGDFDSQYQDFFRRMYIRTRRGLNTKGASVIATSERLFERYEGALLPRETVERPIGSAPVAAKGTTGLYHLWYKDTPILPDWNIADGTTYWLSFPGIKLCTMQGLWLENRGWQDHIHQWGRVTIVICGIQMVVSQPRGQGVIDGFTFN